MVAESKQQFVLTQHLCFFIDFLGTKEAVDWDGSKLSRLIKLLSDMARTSADFEMWEGNCENEQHAWSWFQPLFTITHPGDGTEAESVWFRPAVSTFSDHIVISFNINELKKTNIMAFISPIAWMQIVIARLALAALDLGLLLRGGVSVGPLYHHQGVVIGKALVEAYELESKIANYPRIAVSPRLNSLIESPFGKVVFEVDQDGIIYLEYFRSMMTAATDVDHFSLSKGYKRLLGIVTENTNRLAQQQKWVEMSKWAWFKSKIDDCAEQFEIKNLPQ